MELDKIVTAVITGLFSLAAVWFGFYLKNRVKPGRGNGGTALDVDFTVKSSLSFAAIKVDEKAPFLQEVSTPSLYPFERECSAYFECEKIVSDAAVGFDVTLLNSTGAPAVLSEIGIRVAALAEIEIVPMGNWQSFAIQNEASYVVDMPDLFSALEQQLGLKVTDRLVRHLKQLGLSTWRTMLLRRHRRKVYRGIHTYQFVQDVNSAIGQRFREAASLTVEKLLSMAAITLPADIVVAGKLPNPQFLEKDAAYRFSLTLQNFARYMPNCTVINIYAKTDKGQGFSDPLFVSCPTVRHTDDSWRAKEKPKGLKLEGARIVKRVHEVEKASSEVVLQFAELLGPGHGAEKFSIAGSLDDLRAKLERMGDSELKQAMRDLAAFAYFLKTSQSSESAAKELMGMMEQVAKACLEDKKRR